MRDFLPDEVRRREYVIRVIAETYERYGFEPLETPAVEDLETLLGKYGEEGNQLIFKILRRGEHEASGQADLALRYDLTVPLARVVAEYRAKLPKFFKRYQIQPVWRADRPARGRFREFYQCDVDALGSRSMAVETELCAAVSETLSALGFADFVIRLNHRQVLTAVLDRAGVSSEKHGTALVALDKLDKIGAEGVARELSTRGVEAEAAEKFLRFFQSVPDAPVKGADAEMQREANDSILAKLESFLGVPNASDERPQHPGGPGIDELRDIVRLAEVTPAAGRIRLDPALARGLSYYTGAIMEVAVPDLAGSLGGGGRYDNLVGMFLGEEVPACGFSLGLERIIVVMTERNMFPTSVGSTACDVMITQWNAAALPDALTLARELRGAGYRVDVYPEPDKLDKQLRYASGRGVPLVAIVGDDERTRGEVTIRDLRKRTQESVTRDAVVAHVSALHEVPPAID